MTLDNLFQLSLFAFLAGEAWVTLRDIWRKMSAVDSVGQFQVRMLLNAAFFLAFVTRRLHLLPITSQPAILFLLGTILIWCGIALRWWSIFTLGKFFRVTLTIQEAHHVITEGPYKYLRHPSYTGLLLALVGLGIGLGDWLTLAVISILCGWAIILRIVAEERLLVSALGGEYLEYSKHTKRLIPFIY